MGCGDTELTVQEAEEDKAGHRKRKWGDKVTSQNSLESYTFNMKATTEGEKPQGKIKDDIKKKILDKCDEIISG